MDQSPSPFASPLKTTLAAVGQYNGRHTKSLDVQREELLIPDKSADVETVVGTTRRTRDGYARHGDSGLGY